MQGTPNIARIGTLLGDNTRAQMLSALMHGKALTASELANESGVTAQTATTHLSKMLAGGLLKLERQGRHKYFALASEDIAALLETLMGLAGNEVPLRTLTGPRDAAMREARICYNHLAGSRGIRLYDSLLARRLLVTSSGNLALSGAGERYMMNFGIELEALKASRTPLCRSCLDWSERRSHLAGSLGRAILARFESMRWVKREQNSRVLIFTRAGKQAFDAEFSR
ncbi:MAG: winged helix-turn-helix transcriptional regulator [Granulosicoccus sp.]|nr:winged helix-turn-helix transcriptional regulator [Granulosicoccus sp.]